MLLYIHIPFCDSKCHYCSFNSYVDRFHLKSAYMDALLVQLRFELKRFKAASGSIASLFIGGGTPSTIPPQLYEPIFKTLAPYLSSNVEITTEANPNSTTPAWLSKMKNLGVNRISFGVQSFDENKLKLLNRAHSPMQAIEAIKNASAIGFENISIDLIYGMAGDTKELLTNDIDTAFTLPINHLSAYALTIEENTLFAQKPQMSDEKLEHTRWLFEEIKKHGFNQYEISNFGTYTSRHNLGYWRYEDYMGVGSGAVGKQRNTRLYPDVSIEKYIQIPLHIRQERLSQDDIRFEKIFLGLRSQVGIDASLLKSSQKEKADILLQEGKIRFKNNRYYNDDFLLADEIALYLD